MRPIIGHQVFRAPSRLFAGITATPRGLLLVALCLALCMTATALASHAPSRANRAALIAAIHHDGAIGNRHLYRVVDIRVSSRGPYARASTAPRDHASYQGQLVILRSNHGVWRVIEFGSAGVGCALPKSVQRDLHVTPPASFCTNARLRLS
jgi:hypothetical protein